MLRWVHQRTGLTTCQCVGLSVSFALLMGITAILGEIDNYLLNQWQERSCTVTHAEYSYCNDGASSYSLKCCTANDAACYGSCQYLLHDLRPLGRTCDCYIKMGTAELTSNPHTVGEIVLGIFTFVFGLGGTIGISCWGVYLSRRNYEPL